MTDNTRAPGPTTKQKIAILGGGMGSLAAAYGLTSVPGWQERYDITVYQLGWRLGGKGASGRDARDHQRIEEHGLHVWMGFYENAFRVMRQCYAELGRAPDEPLATWQDAFKPHSYVVWEDQVGDQWLPWAVEFPRNGSTPGDGGVLPSPWDYVCMMVEWMVELFEDCAHGTKPAHAFARVQPLLHEHADIHRAITELSRGAPPPANDASHPLAWLASAVARAGVALESTFLHLARELVHRAKHEPPSNDSGSRDAIAHLLTRFRAWLLGEIGDLERDVALRRAFILLDLTGGNVCGLLADARLLFETDWTVLDDQDYKAWLAPHCVWKGTPECAPVRAFYDLVFSLADGIAAGSTLVCALRMLLTYKGAVFYKMQAGMGDTVFGPLYLVLKRRGVKFEFFHQVQALRTSDGRHVSSIEMGVQATVRDGKEYDPFVVVRGLPCWPGTPNYAQLVEGQALEQGGYDLESAWTDWKNPRSRTLTRGVDYDTVVLGISVGALKYLCPELLAASPKMNAMVENVATTPTQAMQLWFTRDLHGMGWNAPSPVMTSYVEPFDTWADMSQLLPREGWTPGSEPGNVSYLCGELELAQPSPPTGPDPEYPRRMTAQAKQTAMAWLDANARALWPAVSKPDGGLDWSALCDPQERAGAARFDAQYWRANVNPTDRYVQTLPGRTKYRLGTTESGFDNLVLAGDWVRNRLNGGCIEAATMTGLQASRAICGYPQEIIGDPDYTPPPEGASAPTRPASVAPPAPTPAPAPAPAPDTGGLPPFIDRGGNLILRQPFMQRDTMLFAFTLAADYAALARLCDQCLNAPLVAAGLRTRYRPLAPMVSLVCANIGRLQSLDPADARKGHMSELDVGYWVPVVAGTEDASGKFEPERLLWFLPYIFVDTPPAMATGREIYGFPKESGAVSIPRSEGDRAPIFADVIVLPTYTPETAAAPMRVAEVTRVGGDNGASPGVLGRLEHAWDSVAGAAHAMVKGLRELHARGAGEPNGPGFSWELLLNIVNELVHGQMPMVFLQQFRDVEHRDGACYQAIVEAPAVVAGFRGAGLLQGEYRVRVGQYASHPIVRDLGLAGETLAPLVSAWVDFDFRMDGGRVIWSGGRRPAG